MEIRRDRYLNRLISKRNNGLIKVITGIRRSGKSYLLFNLFYDYLISYCLQEDNIITIPLDDVDYEAYCEPQALNEYIKKQITDKNRQYYIFIDEAQYAITKEEMKNSDKPIRLYGVLNALLRRKNVDVYITGSNSKMLSSDVLTQFRDRGDEIRVYPFSFAEFYSCYEGGKGKAFDEYCLYGGMPMSVQFSNHEKKSEYLKNVFTSTYIKDVMERYKVLKDASIMDDLLDIISSSIGSLSNPTKLANTFRSEKI